MSIFKNLFAQSPFSPLQSHMEKVASCVKKLDALFEAYFKKDFAKMNELADEISETEHAADLTKNEIRNHLPKGLFLAVNRGDLLEILGIQDDIADQAEDIGIMMTLKDDLEPPPGMEDEFKNFLKKNMEIVVSAQNIIREMDELLEASFGGKEAEKVKLMVESVAYLEHEADILQRELSKKLFNHGDTMPYTSFTLWMSVLEAIDALGNLSEKLANRVRMLLDIK